MAKKHKTPEELKKINHQLMRSADENKTKKSKYSKSKIKMSAERLNRLIENAYNGSESATNTIISYINDNVNEANTRLSRLKANNLDIYSPTQYLKAYMREYSLNSLPKRDMSTIDDLGELAGQAKSMRKFLSSPLSRVSNAREYMKTKVDYMLDSSGRIQLENQLGRKLTSKERNFLGRMLADSPLSDYLDEAYALTGEILEDVIDEYDYAETIDENIARINSKLTDALNTRQSLLTRYDVYWERRNATSLKTKGEKTYGESTKLR